MSHSWSDVTISAGRLSRNVIMTGNVLLNGKKRRLEYGAVVSIS